MGHDLKHGALTETIIGAAFKVPNALGFGFLEKVYENALAMELEAAGPADEQQRPTEVGLPINFGHSVQIRRRVLTSEGNTVSLHRSSASV